MTEHTDHLALAQKTRARIMALKEHWDIERYDWALLLELVDTAERQERAIGEALAALQKAGET